MALAGIALAGWPTFAQKPVKPAKPAPPAVKADTTEDDSSDDSESSGRQFLFGVAGGP